MIIVRAITLLQPADESELQSLFRLFRLNEICRGLIKYVLAFGQLTGRFKVSDNNASELHAVLYYDLHVNACDDAFFQAAVSFPYMAMH